MPAYLVAEVEITNPEGYAEYSKGVPATVEKFGGRFLARGGKQHPLEGDWNTCRRVIIEFPSIEQAKAWWDSPEYERLKPIRLTNSKGRLMFLEGV